MIRILVNPGGINYKGELNLIKLLFALKNVYSKC